MRITVFTSNQIRHIALLDALVWAGHDVQAVIEPKTYVLPTTTPMKDYWLRVYEAELRTFPATDPRVRVPALVLRPGELSRVGLPRTMLEAERFVVFSASYIQGPLCDLLVQQQALNLHVGISPEYRGSAPNFWAAYQGHPELVGAQVQRLAAGLDAGEILAEVRAGLPYNGDPFVRGMEACRLGINAMVAIVGTPPETWLPLRANDRSQQIQYSRHDAFTESVVADYLGRLEATGP